MTETEFGGNRKVALIPDGGGDHSKFTLQEMRTPSQESVMRNKSVRILSKTGIGWRQ